MRSKGITQRLLALVLAMAMLTVSAAALPQEKQVDGAAVLQAGMVRWANIWDLRAEVSALGRTVDAYAYVEAASSTAKITGTLYLERYSGGRWVRVTSWSISGTGSASLSKTYTGVAGNEYRTRVAVTVSGEKAEATSASCSV